ncbi:methyltransferase, FkbM family [Chitinophaga jiangningensis]|uniref:Methyltransferase, FkbM family n=1 Tax=Chitinophaga jiangningensis TaxID=1419482 RepID=A0A1M6ZZ83_9BACT|nr:FkbM family methyltransferase [Chitinophaga jiangningensis]SHL35801.1 methyltransferase, FkbM family [Chitinophaga jiangningensis]
MKDEAYYPSWKNISKYKQYLSYFGEYVRYGDWRSLGASLKMVLVNKPSQQEWQATSAMGRFRIRRGTTDFQFINYAYERQVRDYLRNQVAAKKLDTFIDIGACIGEYDVWLAAQGVHCIAFEPVNFKAIEENLRLNGMSDKVKLYACGLGSKQEKVNFNIMATVTGSSYVDRNSAAEGNIPIFRLDDLLPEMGLQTDQHIIVKLDVEGMETEVLEGARQFISQYPNLRVIFERYDNDNTVNDKLSELANWAFERIDRYNYLATKI